MIFKNDYWLLDMSSLWATACYFFLLSYYFVFVCLNTSYTMCHYFYCMWIGFNKRVHEKRFVQLQATFFIVFGLKTMKKLNRDNDRDRKLAQKFVEHYLRQDGVFVLKLLAKNSTDLVVADIVSVLWENYKSNFTSLCLKPLNLNVNLGPVPVLQADLICNFPWITKHN